MRILPLVTLLACSSPDAPTAPPPSSPVAPDAPVTPVTPTLPASAEQAARAAVVAAGGPAEGLSLQRAEAVEWSDACLGLGGPAEMCAAMMTPGWRVVLSAGQQRWTVHTDETGAIARLETPTETR